MVRGVRFISGFITEEGNIKSPRQCSVITQTYNTHTLQLSITTGLFMVHASLLVILLHPDTELPS